MLTGSYIYYERVKVYFKPHEAEVRDNECCTILVISMVY